MKTLAIITAVWLAVLTTNVNAQSSAAGTSSNDFREKIAFGIKAGGTNSNVYDAEGEGFRPRPKYGLTAGAFIALPIGKYLGVQPEIALTQRGFYATGMMLGYKYDFTRTTTYIDIPLQLAFKPSPYFSILAGPQYSYLVKQHDVYEDNFITTEQVQQFENDDLRKNVLGATAGFDVTVKHFVFAGRYSFDLQRNSGDGTAETPRYKNSWVQASVGVRF